MIGQMLGHYRILEKIGAGGMGEVYRAHDEHLDRDVAIKVLPGGALSDEEARRRFRKEAEALSKLNHPNIQTVHDFDRQGRVDFLVVEFVPGPTVADKLRDGPLPHSEIASLGSQMAAALEEAHERGVVHRDLKPSNLKVTLKGQLKVLDFGLAKLLKLFNDTATTESRSALGAVVGTLPYMAPEQLQGERVDHRSDIWAAGVVLYEMATGHRPFDAKITAALAGDIQYKPVTPPSQLNPQSSGPLERIILKCLEKEPENRYQTARELAMDLWALGRPPIAVAPGARARLRRRILTGAVALAVAGIAAALVLLDVGGLRGRLFEDAGVDSLAVLPLKNLSGDPAQEYFADAMTEALITELSKIGALKVISRTSVMRYKETGKSLPEIGRELNVDAVVEGSVLRVGERVRVTAQLIRASEDTHLWADNYDRDLRDILALQTDVAKAIAARVRAHLTPLEQAQLSRARPVDPEAYEAYIRGLYHSTQSTEADAEKRVTYFQQAVARDPDYAPAFAALGSSYITLGNYGLMPSLQSYSAARTATLKALALDESLAEAHVSLGDLKHFYEWDHDGAGKEYRRALELNSNLATAHESYSLYLAHLRLPAEALAQAMRARELNPLGEFPGTLVGIAYAFAARQYDKAIEQYRDVIGLHPSARDARWHLALAYIYAGRYQEALAEIRTWEWEQDRLSALTLGYGFAGKRQEALELRQLLLQMRQRKVVKPYVLAWSYIALGEKDEALLWLEKAYEEKDDWMNWLFVDPAFDSLRSDPRFQDLLRRMKFPQG